MSLARLPKVLREEVARFDPDAAVAEGEGRLDRFVCPYHGWTYDLDGTLLKAPDLGRIEAFTREDHGLRPVPVCEWKGFVFVSLEEDPGRLDSIQSSAGAEVRVADSTVEKDFRERIGEAALYAWIYPNFMINRYGP